MNLIEAIKSGKRFRTKTSEAWYYFCDDILSYIDPKGFAQKVDRISRDLLLADFEIEEEKIEITRSQFGEACLKVASNFRPEFSCTIFTELEKELGFK